MSIAWRTGAVAAVAAIGLAGLMQAVRHGAVSEARGESKYVEVASVAITSPDDVMISAQHSGSIRYYAGRLTLRWDYVDANWLDRTVDWLDAHGHHPYFVLEDLEIEAIRSKFPSTSTVARLDWAPVVTFRGGQVTIYDAMRRDPIPRFRSRSCKRQRSARFRNRRRGCGDAVAIEPEEPYAKAVCCARHDRLDRVRDVASG